MMTMLKYAFLYRRRTRKYAMGIYLKPRQPDKDKIDISFKTADFMWDIRHYRKSYRYRNGFLRPLIEERGK